MEPIIYDFIDNRMQACVVCKSARNKKQPNEKY